MATALPRLVNQTGCLILHQTITVKDRLVV